MRKYKDITALSLNPILDMLFLQTNYDDTPFPSLKNKNKQIKSSSLKHLKKQQQYDNMKNMIKLRQKQETGRGSKMANALGDIKKRSLSSTKYRFSVQSKMDRYKLQQIPSADRRSFQEFRAKTSLLVQQPQVILPKRARSNRLRQTIDDTLSKRDNKKRKQGLFNIIISSYRDFQ